MYQTRHFSYEDSSSQNVVGLSEIFAGVSHGLKLALAAQAEGKSTSSKLRRSLWSQTLGANVPPNYNPWLLQRSS